jgi:hypothetical protein
VRDRPCRGTRPNDEQPRPAYCNGTCKPRTFFLLSIQDAKLSSSEQALAAWTGYGCYFSPNPAFQWRFELSAQAIAPLLLSLGTPWIPESPRWLAERGRESEALAILEKLHPDGSGLMARK